MDNEKITIAPQWNSILTCPDTRMSLGVSGGLLGAEKVSIVKMLGEKGYPLSQNSTDTRIFASTLNGLTVHGVNIGEQHKLQIQDGDIAYNSERLQKILDRRGISTSMLCVNYSDDPMGTFFTGSAEIVIRDFLLKKLQQNPEEMLDVSMLRNAMTMGNNAVSALSLKLNHSVPDIGVNIVLHSPDVDGKRNYFSIGMGDTLSYTCQKNPDWKVDITAMSKGISFGSRAMTSGEVSKTPGFYTSWWKSAEDADGIVLVAVRDTKPARDRSDMLRIRDEIQKAIGDGDTLLSVPDALKKSGVRVLISEINSNPVTNLKVSLPDRVSYHSVEELLSRLRKHTIGRTSIGYGREKNEDAFLTPDAFLLPAFRADTQPENMQSAEDSLTALADLLNKSLPGVTDKPYTSARLREYLDVPNRLIEEGYMQNFAIVADGMGGHGDGDIASSVATIAACEYLHLVAENKDVFATVRMPDILDGLFQHASSMLNYVNTRKELSFRKDSRTTLTIVLGGTDGQTYYRSIADSRIYKIFQDRHAEMISNDNSIAWEVMCNNGDTPSELYKYNTSITAGIPYSEDKEREKAHVGVVTLNPGEYLALCSDGAWGDFPKNAEFETVKQQIDEFFPFPRKVSAADISKVMKRAQGFVFSRLVLGNDQSTALGKMDEINPYSADELLDLCVKPNAGTNSHDNVTTVIYGK